MGFACRQESLVVMKMMRMVMAEVVVMMVKHREKTCDANEKKCTLNSKGGNDGDEYGKGNNDTWKRWQQISRYKDILQYMVLQAHTHTNYKVTLNDFPNAFKAHGNLQIHNSSVSLQKYNSFVFSMYPE